MKPTVWTALVTPFLSTDQEVDRSAFDALVRSQLDAGVGGLIPCGTTGESSALSEDERKWLIARTLELRSAHPRAREVRVFAGTGSAAARESIQFSRWAESAGVDGVLVVTPYYVKPSALGLRDYYNSVASAVRCDVMLYNVPGRTGVSLTPQTIAELAAVPNIRSLKEATGNLSFWSDVQEALALSGRTLQLFSGDDPTYLPALSLGANGIVSVASNLVPLQMVELTEFAHAGRWTEARALFSRLYPLLRDLFVESNPVPVKQSLAWAGRMSAAVRPPLAPLTSDSSAKLRHALQRAGVLK